jgi:hypothetical protein
MMGRAAGSMARRSWGLVWLDGRPQQLRIQVTVTDSSLVSAWTADAEEGRTESVVRSRDAVTVRDLVYVDGEARLFAEADYRRSDASAAGPGGARP